MNVPDPEGYSPLVGWAGGRFVFMVADRTMVTVRAWQDRAMRGSARHFGQAPELRGGARAGNFFLFCLE